MYPTVPMMTPASVATVTVGECDWSASPASGCVSFARPKSRILTNPSFLTITFSGFKSLCTIPAPCARASPSAICAAIPRSFFAGKPPSASSSRSVLPSTSSKAM